MGKITKGSEGKRGSIDRPNRKSEIQNFRHRKRKGGVRKPENETQKGRLEKYLKGGNNQRKTTKENQHDRHKDKRTTQDKKGHQTNNEEEKPTGKKKTDNAEPSSSQV
ncbi:unnamed protein product [Polarella glacialis]|uniref:Uncharacterized protein n=1 Tax=Polarella glacialis TaxID=89957 RepID=A0A813EC75_POLGL|nr:unnamed protein product [Polarella glacialis]